jgi:hypothetical protein
VTADGDTYEIDVTGTDNWAVSIPASASWISAEVFNDDGSDFGTLNGRNNGKVFITVEENAGLNIREASITIGGKVHKITQSAGTVNSITPPSMSVTAAGDEYTIRVLATGKWETTISTPAWIKADVVNDDGYAPTTTGGSDVDASNLMGSGNATITVTISGNTASNTRSGTINIGGIEHVVTQTPAFVQGSVSKITPKSRKVRGGASVYNIRATGTNNWRVTTTASWIKVRVINNDGSYASDASNTTGSRNGTVQVTVDPNTTKRRRSGTINIGGRVHKIQQAFR